MMVKQCTVCGETNLKMTNFPSNQTRFEKWCSILKIHRSFSQWSKMFVCQLHFDRTFLECSHRSKFIVPLPRSKSLENINPNMMTLSSDSKMKSIEDSCSKNLQSKTGGHFLQESTLNPSMSLLPRSDEFVFVEYDEAIVEIETSCVDTPDLKKHSVMSEHNYSKEQTNMNDFSEESIKIYTKKDVHIIKNRYEWEIAKKDKKLMQMQTKLEALSQEIEVLKKDKCKETSTTNHKLSASAKALTQLLQNHKNRQEYTTAQKDLCLQIFYMSQRFYFFLRNVIGVPLASKRTVNRWKIIKTCLPGHVSETFDYLASFTNLKDDDRRGTIVNDEIHGRQGLFYDERSDRYIGFEDIGVKSEDRGIRLAKNFGAVMFRSISGRFNVVLGTYATINGINATDLDALHDIYVTKLNNISFTTSFLCSDQAGCNRKFYEQNGASQSSPFIEIGNTSVKVIHDNPHLLKSLRTTLMKYGINTPSGIAKWKFIQMVWEHDQIEADPSKRLCPKLTEDHFNLNTFSSMRVSLATQIISESVSKAIDLLISNGSIDKKDIDDAKSTSNLLSIINKTFDCLNGMDQNDENVYRRGVAFENPAFKFLTYALDFLEGVSHGGPKKVKVYWISGYIMTIRAVLLFCQENQSTLVFPRLLNQDIIEQLFSTIRFSCGNSDSPYLVDYLRILGRLIAVKVLSTTTEANCEQHETNSLSLIQKFNVSNLATKDEDAEWDDLNIEDYETLDEIFELQNQRPMEHFSVAKYVEVIVVRYQKVFKCGCCIKHHDDLKLLAKRICMIVNEVLAKAPHLKNLRQRIFDYLNKSKNLWLSCGHEDKFALYTIIHLMHKSAKLIQCRLMKEEMAESTKKRKMHRRLKILKQL